MAEKLSIFQQLQIITVIIPLFALVINFANNTIDEKSSVAYRAFIYILSLFTVMNSVVILLKTIVTFIYAQSTFIYLAGALSGIIILMYGIFNFVALKGISDEDINKMAIVMVLSNMMAVIYFVLVVNPWWT